MHHGFLKTAMAAPRIVIADPEENARRIARVMRKADERGARILLLPPLSLTGVTCGDLFAQSLLCEKAGKALASLAEQTADLALLAAVGLPVLWEGRLLSCMAVLQSGRILGLVPRKDSPPFAPPPDRSFVWPLEEARIPFGANLLFACATLPSLTFALAVPDEVYGIRTSASLLLVPGGDPYTAGRYERLRVRLRAASEACACAILYTEPSTDESVTDHVWAGVGMAVENGRILGQSKLFAHEILYADIDLERLEAGRRQIPWEQAEPVRVSFTLPVEPTVLDRVISPAPFFPDNPADKAARLDEIFICQAQGLARRLSSLPRQIPVIGLSGGVDSTLALLIACEACRILGQPVDHVLAVTMPGFGTGERSLNAARRLAEGTGALLREISIVPAVAGHLADIGQEQEGLVFENAQARERTQILLDIAGQVGGLVVGAGNMSELALGFCTFGGDQLSHYAVNSGIPKTMVQALVRHLAETEARRPIRELLHSIVDAPISPELLPNQRTEDILGPYALHDFFLYYLVRWHFPPAKIYRLACRAFDTRFTPDQILQTLETFYTRFFASQFKRTALSDGLTVGSVTLSPRGGYAIPSEAAFTLWKEELNALRTEKSQRL